MRGRLPRSRLPQGRGLATEAAAACRVHARDVLEVDRLIAIIASLPTTGLGCPRWVPSSGGVKAARND
jgi:hypothetical protein